MKPELVEVFTTQSRAAMSTPNGLLSQKSHYLDQGRTLNDIFYFDLKKLNLA